MLLDEIAKSEKDGGKIYLIGRIIHNDAFIEEIKSKGVIVIEDEDIKDIKKIEEISDNSAVVIRAHGIEKNLHELLEKIKDSKNIKIVDATCECVRKMHKIAEQNTGEEKDTFTLIIGDKNHPEIVALDSYVNGERRIIKNFEEVKDFSFFDEILNKKFKKLIILAQTTHNIEDYEKCSSFIKEKCGGTSTAPVFFETICGETEKRQAEAELLSRTSDVMIVVGGLRSSNARKLYEICEKNCANSYIVETSEQLPLDIFKNLFGDLRDSKDLKKLKKEKDAVKVSITAGASTPDSTIMEVKKIMTDTINEIAEKTEGTEVVETAKTVETTGNIEEGVENSADVSDSDANKGEKSFAELLDETFAAAAHRRGDRVKGIISYISDGEIHVDLGYKYTGLLAFDEATDDSSVDLKDIFKVGEEIETQIIKINDQDGTALLSKKRIDSNDNWDKIIKFHEEGTVIEGKVVQVVNGGIIVLIDFIKVFVPASHADVSKDTDLNTLVNRKVKVKIIDINTMKRRAIASIRNASSEERKVNEEKLWAEIELNKRYKGVVKSIANYGVFVDIGGIDGMIYKTELSWSRVKHPSEILKLGDNIEVYIKDFDAEKRRISLGYKNEEDNPWTKFTNETNVGDVVDAKILNMMPFGAFAEIVPGVDGLIHISQIASKKISKPSDILDVGDIVQVKITDINPEAKKISLSMRALIEPEEILEFESDVESGSESEADAAVLDEVAEIAETAAE